MKIRRKTIIDAGRLDAAGKAAGRAARKPARPAPSNGAATASPQRQASADRPPATRGRKPVDGLVESRRSQIRDAAIRLFSRNGVHATTLEDVARDADVSVGLIYRYFDGKQDLLFSTLGDIQEDYFREIPAAAASGKAPLERLVLAVHAYGRVVDRHRRASLLAYRISHLLGRDRLKVIMDKELETMKLIRAPVDECIASGVFRPTDAQMFAYQIIVFVHSWAMESWRLPRDLGIDEFVSRGLALMLPAVLAEPGRRTGEEPPARCASGPGGDPC
ncbi:MAG: TetR/AcrR family transcriptional regulator [Lautropia sp.]